MSINKVFIPITKEDSKKIEEYDKKCKENGRFDESRVNMHAQINKKEYRHE